MRPSRGIHKESRKFQGLKTSRFLDVWESADAIRRQQRDAHPVAAHTQKIRGAKRRHIRSDQDMQCRARSMRVYGRWLHKPRAIRAL